MPISPNLRVICENGQYTFIAIIVSMEYRRLYVPGGTYFFTLVTNRRERIFYDSVAIKTFWQAIDYVKLRHPFNLVADVLMPDHLHIILTLPIGDSNFPTRWRLIKSYFSRNYKNTRFSPPLWQNRYWEHLIRDEEDLVSHIDYIHYNPVKHGLTTLPSEWEHSSFMRFVNEGYYSDNWSQEFNILNDISYMD